MTVKEFIDGTNYFKKHNNIRARLFIKFLKKKKKAYLLLYAKFPSHKSCAEEYVYDLWLRQEMYDCLKKEFTIFVARIFMEIFK